MVRHGPRFRGRLKFPIPKENVMSKLMQFVFASYAPLVARFHLVEQSGAVHAQTPETPVADSAPCAKLPERRTAPNARRAAKPHRSMAA
jgi:hypothetical protein